jgi:hypothetical protein
VKAFFLLLPLVLFATVNEPMRCEFFSGYRNDRIHWHLQQPGEGGALTYSEKYRDLQFWENGLVFKSIHRDLVFYARGSYAAFGKGTLFQHYANLSFTSELPQFRFDTHGWAADTVGYFGYAVNLTADRTYKVIFIPLLGYSAHFERLSRKEGRPDPLESSAFTMRSSLPQQLHQTWYGVLLGGGFQIEPGGRFVLQAGYSYHFLHFALKSHIKNQLSIVGISETITNTKVKTSEGDNHGHSGWAQIDYLFSPLWRLGIGAQIRYFSSRVIDATLRQQIETLAPVPGISESQSSEKLKLRWVPISGWVQTSREF